MPLAERVEVGLVVHKTDGAPLVEPVAVAGEARPAVAAVDDRLLFLSAHGIEKARLCDGMVKTLSKHPCGVVIGGNPDISGFVPVLFDKDTGELLADCDKSYIESFYGLLKIDLLSLRTLDAVSNMLANIEKNEKTKINFSEIPEEKEVFSSVFWGGNTDFIFQFGSDGMKDWLRKLHPRNIDELTMLAAAFRPGPMQFLPVIKDVLYGEKQPELISPKLFDRQALSDLLLSTVKNKKCKVVYFLSGNGDLYTNTENLLVRNIGCAGRHILIFRSNKHIFSQTTNTTLE